MFKFALKRNTSRFFMIAALVAMLFSLFPTMNVPVRAAAEDTDYVMTVEKMKPDGTTEYIIEPTRYPVSYSVYAPDDLFVKIAGVEMTDQVMKLGSLNENGLKYKIDAIKDASEPDGWLNNGDYGENSKWFCTVKSVPRKDPKTWLNKVTGEDLAMYGGEVVRFIYSVDGGPDMGISDTKVNANKDELLKYYTAIDKAALDSDAKTQAYNAAKATALDGKATDATVAEALKNLKAAMEGAPTVPATAITITPENPELTVGETVNLAIAVEPQDTTDVLDVTFDQEGIVSYDAAKGMVTALQPGSVKLTAKAGVITKETTITVKAAPVTVPATKITISADKTEVVEGQALQMSATVEPQDTTDSVSWRSENNDIATVDETTGVVTGVKVGDAKIVATAGSVSAEQMIKVVPQAQKRVYFRYNDGRTQEMDEHKTFTLTALDEGNFVVDGADGLNIEWDCSSKYYEDVSGGSGGGNGQGMSTHYWIGAYNGKFSPFEIKTVDARVYNADTHENIETFKINQVDSGVESLKLYVDGEEYNADKNFVGQGSQNYYVRFKANVAGKAELIDVPLQAVKMEATDGAWLRYDGRFSVENNGTFQIKAHMVDNPKIAGSFTVTSAHVDVKGINVRVPSVWYIDDWNGLAGYYVGIQRGNDSAKNFNYSVSPENASNKSLVWKALTPEIAEYFEYFGNGIVPNKAGIAKFEVSSAENPEIKQEVSVEFKYKNPLTSASMDQNTLTMGVYETKSLKINVTPSNATEQRFIWTYDKEGIVNITEDIITDSGSVVTPRVTKHTLSTLKDGTVTVTGTPMDTTGGAQPITFKVIVGNGGPQEGPVDPLQMAKDDRQVGLDFLSKLSKSEAGDEWNVFSTLRAGGEMTPEERAAYYQSAVNALKNDTDLQPTDRSRMILALGAMGYDATNLEGFNAIESICNTEKLDTLSSNQIVWTLIAVDSRNYKIPEGTLWNRDSLIEGILSFQAKDGSYSLNKNAATGGIDMTGMFLQAVAPYKDDPNHPEVKEAVNRALEYLKAKKTPNAGFKEGGSENSCTASQVLTALTALGIDPIKAENGFTFGEHNLITNLNRFKAENGGFECYDDGKADPEGTKTMPGQQVTYALESYIRFAEGRNRLYDLTDVPVLNPSVTPDQEAAQAVIDQINALGQITSLDQKPAVEAARKAYDALSDAQKALVTNVDALTQAEAKIAELGKTEPPAPTPGTGNEGNTGNTGNQTQVQNSASNNNQTVAKGNVATGLMEQQNMFYGAAALMAVAALAGIAVMRRRKED